MLYFKDYLYENYFKIDNQPVFCARVKLEFNNYYSNDSDYNTIITLHTYDKSILPIKNFTNIDNDLIQCKPDKLIIKNINGCHLENIFPDDLKSKKIMNDTYSHINVVILIQSLISLYNATKTNSK